MPRLGFQLSSIALALLVAAAPGCRRESEPPPGVIATIGDRQPTAADFQRYLDRNAGTPLNQLAPAAASALLDQFIDEILVAELAESKGVSVTAAEIEGSPVSDAGESSTEKSDQIRRSKYVASLSAQLPGPSEAELVRYYQQHPEEFRTGDQVHTRQILMHDEKEAAAAVAELRKGAAFEEVSKKYSKAPNAARGGDIGFVGRGQLPKIFEDVIFSLKPGEFSSVIKTETNFFHIFKVDEVRKAGTVPFAIARPVIEQKLKEEKLRSELERQTEQARQELNVAVYPRRLGFRYTGKYATTSE